MSTMTEGSYECDGECGSEIIIKSHNSKIEVTKEILIAAGWLVVNNDEAYCPTCQHKADRITKVRKYKVSA